MSTRQYHICLEWEDPETNGPVAPVLDARSTAPWTPWNGGFALPKSTWSILVADCPISRPARGLISGAERSEQDGVQGRNEGRVHAYPTLHAESSGFCAATRAFGRELEGRFRG